jgi:predicted nucleotide-binding protein
VGEELVKRTIQSQEAAQRYDADYRKWTDYNEEMLRRLFTTDAIHKEYRFGVSVGTLSMGPDIYGMGYQSIKIDREKVSGRITKLESILARLELYPEPSTPAPVATNVAFPRDCSKVFVVHGHDEGAREAVARFLERLGIQPIILHEQANQGRTVIEKVEVHSEVGFAVVLLTPDDVGGAKDGTLSPRARQNVVLELGYFVGRLGRKHVCALKRGEVEIPSDFAGVVYEIFDDSGGWRQRLAAELEAADFRIDWNKVMRP